MTLQVRRAKAARVKRLTLPILCLVVPAGTAAVAQTPAPAPTPPPVITLPGVENFSLPPSGQQPTPAPTPTPTATAAPPPVVPTVPSPTAATPTPSPTATARRSPTPEATAPPTPTVEPTPAASPLPSLVAEPAPVPSPPPTVEAAPAQGGALWPWFAGGAALLLTVLAALWWRRSRAQERHYEEEYVPVAAKEPAAPETAQPVAQPVTSEPEDDFVIEPVPVVAPPPPPPPAPSVAPAAAATPAAPFATRLEPTMVTIEEGGAVLEFAYLITNQGTTAADAVRPLLGMVTAGPDLDGQITQFHASAPISNNAEPFTLQPGETRRVTGQVALPRESMHVTTANNRPMIVPVVLANLRWRAGLTVRTFTDAFIVGTGLADVGKLGPFWLDRGARQHIQVAARRFDPVQPG